MIPKGFFRGIVRGRSTLRAWQNAVMARTVLEGLVLDLGSGSEEAFPFRLGKGATLVRSNLALNPKPDVCFDLEKPFPFRDKTFDHVTMINVIEHLFRYRECLQEIQRVLKPGGWAICCAPFLYRVHPSPRDFYRFTESAIERLFSEAGFEKVHIERTGTGSFLASYSLIDDSRIPGWLRLLPVVLAMGIDRLIALRQRLLKQPNYREEYYPLGYLVAAQK